MYETNLSVEYIGIDELVMYKNNAKLHDSQQVDQIAASIEEFGFNSPILAWHNDDGEPEIVAGHGRLMAARKLGLEKLPVVFLDHMSEEQRRAFCLVENQLTLASGFDSELLEIELGNISIDMEQFGFEIEDFEPSFDDVVDETEPDEGVSVKVSFNDPELYQKYRDVFADMEKDGAAVSIS